MDNKSPLADQTRIIGTVKIACQSVTTPCSICGMDVQAWLLDGAAHCPKCDTIIPADSSTPRIPSVLPFFHLPQSCRQICGTRPTHISIIPASTSLEQTLHQEFSRFGEGSGIPVCVGNGTKAVTRQSGRTTIVDCTGECIYRQSAQCKASGRFLFYLPDVSLQGLFQIRMSSMNASHLQKCLRALSDPDGMIAMQLYTLKLNIRQSRQGHQYTLLELTPHQAANDNACPTREAICAS